MVWSGKQVHKQILKVHSRVSAPVVLASTASIPEQTVGFYFSMAFKKGRKCLRYLATFLQLNTQKKIDFWDKRVGFYLKLRSLHQKRLDKFVLELLHWCQHFLAIFSFGGLEYFFSMFVVIELRIELDNSMVGCLAHQFCFYAHIWLGTEQWK